MADYTNKAQQRIIRLVEFLAGHEEEGLALKEVAVGMGTTLIMAFRDLNNLAEIGWAREMGTGRWCMAAGSLRPLVNVRNGIEQARSRIDRIEKEYLGGNNG